MSNVVAISGYLDQGTRLDSEPSNNLRELANKDQNAHWMRCLVKIAKSHDQQAFKALFDYFGPRLKSFLMKQQLSEAQSEELIQETFISVWKFANYFEANKGQVSTWIYTIARNKKLDYFRKCSRQVPTTELISEDFAVEHGNQFASRFGDELCQIIPQLPPEQIEVLQKVYFEQLSHQVTADRLGITLGTVKGRIRSAINNLNQLMRGAR